MHVMAPGSADVLPAICLEKPSQFLEPDVVGSLRDPFRSASRSTMPWYYI
jgi:hypothetical protein